MRWRWVSSSVLACLVAAAGVDRSARTAAEPDVVATPEAPGDGDAYDAPLHRDGEDRDGEDRDEDEADDDGFAFASAPVRKSVTIGALDAAACAKALKKHKIPHKKAPGAPKIEQPIILTGPVGGVHFDTGRPYAARTIGFGDAIDCRLAVALVDLAKVVKKHGVSTVLVKSFHRPTQAILDPNAPLRHRIGFAIDIAGFKTKKGHVWNVQHDFHGKIGQATCGKNAAKPIPDSKVSRELWSVFCQIAATEAFDSGISPNYNQSHFDHVHFDLTADHPLLFFP